MLENTYLKMEGKTQEEKAFFPLPIHLKHIVLKSEKQIQPLAEALCGRLVASEEEEPQIHLWVPPLRRIPSFL